MKKILSLILAMALVLGLGAGAFAAEVTTRQAELYYREVKILIDGKELIPQDVNGKSTEPFLMEGTTYLPIRAVASALGLKVDWDGKTNTIYLSSGGQINYGSGESVGTRRVVSATLGYRGIRVMLDGKPLSLTDVNGKTVDPFLIGGTTYVPVRAISNALGLEVDWNGLMSTVILSTGKGYYPETVSRSTIHVLSGQTVEEKMEYSYNADGSPARLRYTSPERSYTASVSYDKAGRMTKLSVVGTNINWGLEYSYDAAKGWLVFEKTWDGGDYVSKTYSYDAQGRVIKQIDSVRSSGVVTNTETVYTYDKAGKLTLEVSKSGKQEIVTQYSYDEAGRLITLTNYHDGHTLKTVYTYDKAGNLVAEDHFDCGVPFGSYVYTYNSSNQLLSTAYSYADFSSLETLSYDAQGRTISQTYTDSTGLKHSTLTEYDSYGNVCFSRYEEENGQSSYFEEYSYEYNSEGDLIARSRTDSKGGSYSYTASHDALGRVLRSDSSIGNNASLYLAEYELGPWPVSTIDSSVGATSYTDVEYKVFASDRWQDQLRLLHELLDGHAW